MFENGRIYYYSFKRVALTFVIWLHNLYLRKVKNSIISLVFDMCKAVHMDRNKDRLSVMTGYFDINIVKMLTYSINPDRKACWPDKYLVPVTAILIQNLLMELLNIEHKPFKETCSSNIWVFLEQYTL